MKKTFICVFAAIMIICSIATTISSCADREDGENNSDYVLRNSINGTGWSIYDVLLEDGTWVSEHAPEEEVFLPLYFQIKFSASNKNFDKFQKYYYDSNGMKDNVSEEKYKKSDNTAFTIKDGVVEGTADGTQVFKMQIKGEVASILHCIITFYSDNRTFEIKMNRAVLL